MQDATAVRGSQRPTGTITFLFTDIEGSTERWERDRAAMQVALRRHDAILRAAIESADGFVFKTIGDAFCAVFERAPAGVAAALHAQRELAAEDFSAVDGIRVRMALHTGIADERDDDYYGPTVNRVARLLSIGHGGQVLLSRATADLAKAALPDGVTLRDMGLHRLKDLVEAELVHQLCADDLRSEFPALRSLDSHPHNLPQQATSFVGRETELAEVAALVREHRIVTLAGTGGVGKTRLSLQVASEELERFRDGVWFVAFAPAQDGGLVPARIAAALGLHESPTVPMIETVLGYLKTRALLLVFDNCEHLVGEAAEAAARIVESCPNVKILATSREPLRVPGEQVYRMPSLPLPEAVALFADRARAADARFSLTDANAGVVGEICRRLDGIALAIELAAARVRALSLNVLQQKLDERFRVLTGGSRTALPRQQTLRALIDWSYDLLGEAERAFFARLSVFAGGFTLELATAVCAGGSIDELEVMDLLASLVEKSLVQTETLDDGETRYHLLESMRDYAREKLAQFGEAESLARAHAIAFADLAARLDDSWDTTPDKEWGLQAEPEIENWRAALRWAFGENGDASIGRQLAASLRPVWFRMAPSEGRQWIRKSLEDGEAEVPKKVLAQLRLGEAHLSMLAMEYGAACSAANEATALFSEIYDEHGL
ncbi:MAG TPA: adenylate/guanylate cyclase domain-containing protein, partial [Verrucomicrobiae bacterium]|nr:adenylate/guanylate cyclase domain-containing protein [Verrucomicrobiae bacterium]